MSWNCSQKLRFSRILHPFCLSLFNTTKLPSATIAIFATAPAKPAAEALPQTSLSAGHCRTSHTGGKTAHC